ncbi:MAG: glycerol-3-phosphate acyltransferase [Lysobacteraceae bacterium]|nr:MAG: glycerol-3-phosphate acyltransferase [Xanthomonadaceae bacterium]
MNIMLASGFIVAAYLLGSVSGSLLLGKLRGVDIRQVGSGNAGGTNALRTQGWQFALAVVIVDIGKGSLAAWLPTISNHSENWLSFACAFAAIVGHMYPVFYGFRGGKGAATWIGGLVILSPFALLAFLLSALVVLIATGWVGLSTITASVVSAVLIANSEGIEGGLWAMLAALLIVIAHRENIQRMLAGSENRFDKVTLGYWLRRRK